MSTRTEPSASAPLRRERREHSGRPDRDVAQTNSGRRKNGIADGGRDDRRARLAEADGRLDALDELDVELRHVADAQRRIAVEVRVLHLAFDELGSLIERHAEAPQGAAFDLRERTVWMNECARIDDDRELFDGNGAAAAVDTNARDASDPCGH